MELMATKHTGSSNIYLTNSHLHLFINDKYYVDLMQGEHQFLICNFDGAPVAAWYCAENNVAVDLEVINFLVSSDFIWSKTELPSNEYTLNVNMHKTCRKLVEEAL